MKAYWYCSFCKAVKSQVPAPANVECDDVEHCPDCRNNSLVWLRWTPRARRVTGPQPFLKRQPSAIAGGVR